jgi:hypothetical protein
VKTREVERGSDFDAVFVNDYAIAGLPPTTDPVLIDRAGTGMLMRLISAAESN